MNFQESVTVAIGALCEAFNRAPSDATFQAYEWGLAGMSAEDVQSATQIALRQCRFMPAPSELRELVVASGESADSRAIKAWMAFDRAMLKHGWRIEMDFDDVLINATARSLGGLNRFRESDTEAMVWLRKDFIHVYATFLRHSPSLEHCLPLPAPLPPYYGHERESLHVDTGLELGPVQRELVAERRTITHRSVEVPQVEFKRP